MPTAKPTGHRLGPGTCGCSRLGSKSRMQQIQASSQPGRRQRRNSAHGANYDGSRRCLHAGSVGDPVLGPAAVDELADLGAHLDLRRPLARALVRALRGRVDAELAADELARRRVVEVVERARR